MDKLHLDSEYRDRYQEYIMADGREFDSRIVNWRSLQWEKVIAIKTFVKDKIYITHCKHNNFKFFVVYRCGGQKIVGNRPKKIKEWSVGWSDGENAFMTDIDFKTGEILRQSIVPVKSIVSHIHPRVMSKSSVSSISTWGGIYH